MFFETLRKINETDGSELAAQINNLFLVKRNRTIVTANMQKSWIEFPRKFTDYYSTCFYDCCENSIVKGSAPCSVWHFIFVAMPHGVDIAIFFANR